MLFASVGLVAGLGAGILFADIDLSGPPEPSTALFDAVQRCAVHNQPGIELGDFSQSLMMDGEGTDYLDEGADESDIDCVLHALDIPDSVFSLIRSTRALDGRQSREWGKFSASWSFHPEDGTNVIIETLPQPGK